MLNNSLNLWAYDIKQYGANCKERIMRLKQIILILILISIPNIHGVYVATTFLAVNVIPPFISTYNLLLTLAIYVTAAISWGIIAERSIRTKDIMLYMLSLPISKKQWLTVKIFFYFIIDMIFLIPFAIVGARACVTGAILNLMPIIIAATTIIIIILIIQIVTWYFFFYSRHCLKENNALHKLSLPTSLRLSLMPLEAFKNKAVNYLLMLFVLSSLAAILLFHQAKQPLSVLILMLGPSLFIFSQFFSGIKDNRNKYMEYLAALPIEKSRYFISDFILIYILSISSVSPLIILCLALGKTLILLTILLISAGIVVISRVCTATEKYRVPLILLFNIIGVITMLAINAHT